MQPSVDSSRQTSSRTVKTAHAGIDERACAGVRMYINAFVWQRRVRALDYSDLQQFVFPLLFSVLFVRVRRARV